MKDKPTAFQHVLIRTEDPHEPWVVGFWTGDHWRTTGPAWNYPILAKVIGWQPLPNPGALMPGEQNAG